MDRMRDSIGHATEHLSRGELLAALGAAVILIVTWLFFGVLLGQFLLGTASELTVLLSLGVLGVVYLQAKDSDKARGSHDATDRHRTWLMLLCGAIAVLAIISAVELLRLAFNGQSNEQWLTGSPTGSVRPSPQPGASSCGASAPDKALLRSASCAGLLG